MLQLLLLPYHSFNSYDFLLPWKRVQVIIKSVIVYIITSLLTVHLHFLVMLLSSRSSESFTSLIIHLNDPDHSLMHLPFYLIFPAQIMITTVDCVCMLSVLY